MKTPKGTRDSGPEREELRSQILKECERVFELYGARRTDTPTFELYDMLMKKYENDETEKLGFGEKEIFVLESKKENSEKCALRYDLTVPFSRYVKMNRIKSMKRYQIGKVFRRDKPSPGRYREFMQCDYDCLDKNNEVRTDIETLTLLNDILTVLKEKFGLPEYIIRINSREIINDMLTQSDIDESLFSTVCSSIDKLDKISWDDVKNEISAKGVFDISIQKLGKFFFQKDITFVNKNTVDKMEKILKERLPLKLDTTLCRGLTYYTGIIFEVVLKNEKSLSIAGGGRYDNLCDIPCVGFSLGIDRILEYIKTEIPSSVKVWVLEINKGNKIEITDYRMEVVNILRKRGISRDTSLKSKQKSVKKQFKYASDNKIPYSIIIGETEYQQRLITLKDMNTKTQKTMNLNEFSV
jgi:histidyl-tRNA synthetase